jgi:cytochrome c-type biogenesis protein CcmH
MNRRRFLVSAVASVTGAVVVGGRSATAQQVHGATVGIGDSSNLFAMDQAAAQSVRRPPKPGATPSMTEPQRDELEHRIRCQCGCTLDVYTCRTTDFSCRVSPAMHKDVMGLVAGGYSAQEILDAFVGEYGERVLMAPPARGFNLLGYLTPFIALAAGGVLLVTVLRRWGRGRDVLPVTPIHSTTNATPEELARINEAMRRDE